MKIKCTFLKFKEVGPGDLLDTRTQISTLQAVLLPLAYCFVYFSLEKSFDLYQIQDGILES